MKILVAVSLLLSGFAWGQKIDVGFDGGAALKSPFYFSVRVPEEGNYRVTVTLGDREAASVTTIKAELRRLMVEKVETQPGEFVNAHVHCERRVPLSSPAARYG